MPPRKGTFFLLSQDLSARNQFPSLSPRPKATSPQTNPKYPQQWGRFFPLSSSNQHPPWSTGGPWSGGTWTQSSWGSSHGSALAWACPAPWWSPPADPRRCPQGRWADPVVTPPAHTPLTTRLRNKYSPVTQPHNTMPFLLPHTDPDLHHGPC